MTVQGQHSSGLTSLTPEGRAAHVWTPGQELAAKLLFGGLGCMIAVVFTHPVDVIKTRLQLQGEAIAAVTTTSVVLPSSSTSVLAATHTLHPTTTSSPTAGGAVMRAAITPATTVTATQTTQTLRLIPLLRQILRTEGPRVFVAGLAPAVLRESIYSTIRFGSYDYFKGIYSGMGAAGLRGGEETTTLVKLMSGLTSGMIGSAIANPTDLIKGKPLLFFSLPFLFFLSPTLQTQDSLSIYPPSFYMLSFFSLLPRIEGLSLSQIMVSSPTKVRSCKCMTTSQKSVLIPDLPVPLYLPDKINSPPAGILA